MTRTRSSATDVLIVGGGVIGTAIADALAREGLCVRLLEAESIGAGASGAAAGMLAPISEAQNETPFLRLGLESLALFPSLCERLREETGIDPEFEPSGLVRLALSEEQCKGMQRLPSALAIEAEEQGWALSPELEWLDAAALREGGLIPECGAEGAVYSPHEAHVRPPLLVRALARSAEARGARIEPGVRVVKLHRRGSRIAGVESSEGILEADCVVLAAGVHAPGLLEAGSVEGPSASLPIEPVRGQILSLDAPLPPMRPICWAPGIYFVPKRDGSWVVGATEERVGFDRRVTAAGIESLLASAMGIFPGLSEATLGRTWSGLRPVSRDGLPAVGRMPGWDGLIAAAGHGRNGVLLAPMTARLVADTILGKEDRSHSSMPSSGPDSPGAPMARSFTDLLDPARFGNEALKIG